MESLDLFAPDLSQILCCKPDPIGAFPQPLLSNLKTQAWFYFTLCLYFTWYNFVFRCYWQQSHSQSLLGFWEWDYDGLYSLWFYLIPFLTCCMYNKISIAWLYYMQGQYTLTSTAGSDISEGYTWAVQLLLWQDSETVERGWNGLCGDTVSYYMKDWGGLPQSENLLVW